MPVMETPTLSATSFVIRHLTFVIDPDIRHFWLILTHKRKSPDHYDQGLPI